MNNSKKHKWLFISVILLLFSLVVIFHSWIVNNNSEADGTLPVILQFAEVLCVVLTVLFTVQQLIDSKEIARATFVLELNQNYVGNSEYMHIYNVLQSLFDGMKSNKPSADNDKTDEIDKSSISNYLTFFETIYVLKGRGVISFDIIDDLFAYRFFLAVHSELFQKSKLETQPENFRNIFKLENEWLEYRISIGKNSREKLDEAYHKYISMSDDEKKNMKWDNVYEARQLRCLMDKKEYEKLIND